MTSGTTARRAAEVFAAALEQSRAGRMTMAEVCAQLGTSSKTLKYHIGKGWLAGTVENIGGKEMWLFDPDAVARYVKIRAENEGRALQAGRHARGGHKLAEAPPGFVTLIDVAAQTGHSMDFMRAAAPRLGFETFRGPKRVFMVRAEDVPRLIEAVAATPPRPGRQKKGDGRMSIMWTDEMDAELGKMPDSMLAGRLGVSVAAVQQRRKRLGIAGLRRRGLQIDWTEEMDSELGRASDASLAEKWGLSRQTVKQRRQRLGIENCHSPEGEVDEFGTRRHGSRRHVDWTEEMLGALGTETDLALSRRWGISAGVISIHRRTLGIPAFAEGQAKGQKIMAAQLSPALRAKVDEAKPLLLNKLSELGVTLPDVTDEQVIGYALDQVIRQAAAAERGRGEAE